MPRPPSPPSRWIGTRFSLLLLAVTLFWTGQSCAADLHSALTEVTARFQFPGALLLVSGPDGIETATTGLADLATQTPVTENTRFHVASVGKILTAVATLQMVETGGLSLDDPVRPFLNPREAERLTHVETATIAQLLSHTSGIPDCLRNASFSTPEHPGISWTASEALRQGRCRPATPPGSYVYSNSNYILLGHILEQRDGGDLAEILERRVLTPLGMADSTAMVSPSDPRLAHGYRRPGPQGERKDASLLAWSSRLGDAPLTTTARDLERFFSSLFRPGQRLLSPDMLLAMTVERGKDEDEGYGWGLQRVATDVGIRYGHSGRFAGFSAEAWYYPDKDRIIILLANGDEHTEDEPMDLIESRLF
ncbi:Beta-lactamase class C and other penicillin binding protein [Candidatus Terasakiella magnetica]|nr:Beta-lactamase class C and other penicillin binding protein [Candidatus Terasakiella magnetica]